MSGKQYGVPQGKKARAASRYFGVSVLKTGQTACLARLGTRWRAQIRIGGVEWYGKACATEREAALAYDMYVIEHRLNLPLNILKPKAA